MLALDTTRRGVDPGLNVLTKLLCRKAEASVLTAKEGRCLEDDGTTERN